jgi:hypothetical protein
LMTSSFRLLVLVSLLTNATAALSQSFYAIRKERSLIGYVGAGSATYFGELSPPKNSITPFKYGLNVGLEHFLTNRISARAEATWFQISGSDANALETTKPRNLSFTSNCVEANVAGTLNLLPNGRRFYQRQAINFYGFLGIGFVYANPKTEYNGQMVALQPLETEGVHYSRVHLVIPFGGGMKLKMGPFFNLAIEGGMRKTFTDYLDDVSSRNYPDPATLKSDLARALSNRSPGGTITIRGNPETKDWYFMMNAKLQYYLPYDLSAIRRNKLYTQKRKYNRRR